MFLCVCACSLRTAEDTLGSDDDFLPAFRKHYSPMPAHVISSDSDTEKVLFP